MKVLLLTNLFPNNKEPNRGVFVKQSSVQLAKWCELVVVAPVNRFLPRLPRSKGADDKQVMASEERIDGIRVLHPSWFSIPVVSRLLNGFLLYSGLRSCIDTLKKEFDFDVIYAHWLFPDGFAAALLSRLFKKPLVLHAHGCDVNQYLNDWFRRKMIVYAIEQARDVIVVSEPMRRRLMEHAIPERKIVHVPNGITRNLFCRTAVSSARLALGLPRDAFIFLFVGSFEHVKGLDTLLPAFKRYLQSVPKEEIYLYLIGQGPLESTLREFIRDNSLSHAVRIVGSVKHDKIPAWMNAADMLCLPSIREGMPNVVLEAQSCGKPVIASKVGAIPDIISDERFGLLVEPGSEESLLDAFKKCRTMRWEPAVIERNPLLLSWESHARAIYELLLKECGVDAHAVPASETTQRNN